MTKRQSVQVASMKQKEDEEVEVKLEGQQMCPEDLLDCDQDEIASEHQSSEGDKRATIK